MAGVHLVGAVHTAGADDADGRLAAEHGARLHGAGVGAQHNVVINIEGILRVAGRVILRNVHQLEVEVIQLHLGALHHLKAHAGEAVHQLVHHQGQRMLAARGGHGAGLGHVDGLPAQGRLLLQLFQGGELFLQHGGHLLPRVVDHLARGRALLGVQLTHAAQ